MKKNTNCDEPEIMVSIYCLAYNHEKYIRKTLDGFFNQDVNFRIEIIIHDDSSTDHTADIIREYQKKHSNIIAIFQKENQYSKGKDIVREYIRPHVRGKYVAICEGDDYWTDTLKLQKQINVLENNPSCFLCAHNVEEVFENGVKTGKTYPEHSLKTGLYHPLEFLNVRADIGFCHMNSYVVLKEKWVDFVDCPPDFSKICPVGDTPLLLYFCQLGDCYYMSDKMSCYRRGVGSGWTKSIFKNTDIFLRTQNGFIKTYKLFDKYTSHRYTEICNKLIAPWIFSALIIGMKPREIFKAENVCYLKNFSKKMKIFSVFGCAFPRKAASVYWNRMRRNLIREGYNL